MLTGLYWRKTQLHEVNVLVILCDHNKLCDWQGGVQVNLKSITQSGSVRLLSIPLA
jgi:hypothetical protein